MIAFIGLVVFPFWDMQLAPWLTNALIGVWLLSGDGLVLEDKLHTGVDAGARAAHYTRCSYWQTARRPTSLPTARTFRDEP